MSNQVKPGTVYLTIEEWEELLKKTKTTSKKDALYSVAMEKIRKENGKKKQE